MKVTKLIPALLFIMLLPMAGCAGLQAAGHEYLMRGQIIEVKENSAYLCIGSQDGARIGQEFTVYRLERRQPVIKNAVSYNRIKSGTVKIIQINDEHMATAKVIDGEAKANNIVELNP